MQCIPRTFGALFVAEPMRVIEMAEVWAAKTTSGLQEDDPVARLREVLRDPDAHHPGADHAD